MHPFHSFRLPVSIPGYYEETAAALEAPFEDTMRFKLPRMVGDVIGPLDKSCEKPTTIRYKEYNDIFNSWNRKSITLWIKWKNMWTLDPFRVSIKKDAGSICRGRLKEGSTTYMFGGWSTVHIPCTQRKASRAMARKGRRDGFGIRATVMICVPMECNQRKKAIRIWYKTTHAK